MSANAEDSLGKKQDIDSSASLSDPKGTFAVVLIHPVADISLGLLLMGMCLPGPKVWGKYVCWAVCLTLTQSCSC
jgi:hypothetical protein